MSSAEVLEAVVGRSSDVPPPPSPKPFDLEWVTLTAPMVKLTMPTGRSSATTNVTECPHRAGMARLAIVSFTSLLGRSLSHTSQRSCAGSGSLRRGHLFMQRLASMTRPLMVVNSYMVATSMWSATSRSHESSQPQVRCG